MADLAKGKESKETVAPTDAKGDASDASTLDTFASDSREIRECDEDDATDDDVQDRPEGSGREQPSSGKSRSKTPLLLGALGLGMAVGIGMGYVDRDSQVTQARKEAGAAVQGKGNEA